MPNADRECNSPRAIRCHADDPISVTIGANRSETTPKRGLPALLPTSGTQDQAAGAMRGRFEPFFEPAAANVPCRLPYTPQSQSKSLATVSWLHRRPKEFRAHPVSGTRKAPAD